MGKGLALFEERMVAKQGADGYAFDPMTIIAIISAIIPLLQGCFNATPRGVRRRLLNRTRLAAAIRRELPALSWAEAYKAADDSFDVADKASDEEVEQFIADCCH